MRIPEIRAQMLAEADACADPALKTRLLTWERELHRRPYARKAEPSSNPSNRGLAARIRRHAAANPDAPLHEIAAAFGVNPGRVSEAIAGKRT